MSDITVPSWRPQQERSGLNWMWLAIPGGILAVAAIGGALVWGLSGSAPRVVPVVEADSRPIKVRPADPGGLIVPNQGVAVLEQPELRRQAERNQGQNSRLGEAPETPQLDALRQQTRPPEAPRAAPQAPAPQAPANGSALQAPSLPPPVAATPAAAPAAPPALKPVAGGRGTVQLAAVNSEEAAKAEWARLTRRVPELAAFRPTIVKIEREGQAPIFRLRSHGLVDLAAARSLCEAVRAKGGNCVASAG